MYNEKTSKFECVKTDEEIKTMIKNVLMRVYHNTEETAQKVVGSDFGIKFIEYIKTVFQYLHKEEETELKISNEYPAFFCGYNAGKNYKG